MLRVIHVPELSTGVQSLGGLTCSSAGTCWKLKGKRGFALLIYFGAAIHCITSVCYIWDVHTHTNVYMHVYVPAALQTCMGRAGVQPISGRTFASWVTGSANHLLCLLLFFFQEPDNTLIVLSGGGASGRLAFLMAVSHSSHLLCLAPVDHFCTGERLNDANKPDWLKALRKSAGCGVVDVGILWHLSLRHVGQLARDTGWRLWKHGTFLGEFNWCMAVTVQSKSVQTSHCLCLSFQVSFNKLLKGLGREPQYTYIIAGGDR